MRDVRTNDDTLILVKLMLFYELVDVETMVGVWRGEGGGCVEGMWRGEGVWRGEGMWRGEGPVLDIAKSTRVAMPAIRVHVQCTVGGEICVCESLCVSMYCVTCGML